MPPTKTTTIDEIDAWQEVAAGTLVVGDTDDISDAYDAMCYIEAAITDTDASDGIEITVEVSYADNNWVEWSTFKGTAETAATTQIADNPAPAGATEILLDDSSTGDFNVLGRKWFIKDGTVANSESVRTQADDGSHDVSLCQDTLREHAVDTNCYDRVDEWTVQLPDAASAVRVLYNNVDANADYHVTMRISKTTGV